MTSLNMGDNSLECAVPSAEERRTVYKKGFCIWQSLYMRATEASGFPAACFQIQPALLCQPHFPNNLDLKPTYNYLHVSGILIWNRSQGRLQEPCNEEHNIPPLEQYFQIPVSIEFPTSLGVSTDLDLSHQK